MTSHHSPLKLFSIAAIGILSGILATPAIAQEMPPQPAAQAHDHGHNHAQDAAGSTSLPKEKADLLQPLKGDHILGHPDAPVMIIEYASLSCSHCADFHNNTFPELKKQYIDTGKVLFIYRHFPLNEPALRGAMLTECADDKFYSFLKVLFKSQNKWAYSPDHQNALRTLASVGGLSGESFDSCMADKKLENRLISHLKWASDELSVSSTPTLFVNGEMVQGSRTIEALGKVIDEELKKARAE